MAMGSSSPIVFEDASMHGAHLFAGAASAGFNGMTVTVLRIGAVRGVAAVVGDFDPAGAVTQPACVGWFIDGFGRGALSAVGGDESGD
jgi:hypothetical protein